FRLIVYLLIAGSVPLFCALYVFYWQSAHYAEQEYETFVKRSHEMIVKQLEQNLDRLERLAVTINSVSPVQRIAESDNEAYVVQTEVLPELNRLVTATLAEDYPVRDICLSFADTNLNVCSSQTVMSVELPPNKDEARYETFTDGTGGAERLRYVAPIYPLFTSEVKGYIAFVIDERKLLNPSST